MNTKDKKAEVLELLSHTKDSGLIDEVYHILHPECAIDKINIEEMPAEL